MKYLELIALIIFYILVVILWGISTMSLIIAIKSNNDILMLLSGFYLILSLIWTGLAVFLTLLRNTYK